MFKNKRVLALVPARGGSKGIKNKNIIDLCGKPLIAYSIEAAKKSKYIDDIVVSTDSDSIAHVAREYGAEIPFMRPDELASDDAKTIDAVLHVINGLREREREYECLVLLQATQPLRTSEDIDSAIETFYKNEEKALVSVSEAEENPVLMRTITSDNELESLLKISSTCRRQDMPKFYKVNGCIYVNRIKEITYATSFNDNIIPYIMPQERSVDIDEMKDLALAEYFLKN